MREGPRRDPTLDWLLDGDPSVRFQALRDLASAPASAVARAQSAVAREGWGARLLAVQDADGRWASGLYTPKWTSTTYTMLLLRDLGLAATNRQARKACSLLLDRGLHRDGGISYGSGRGEHCVTGMVLSILSHFRHDDARLDALADWLLGQQMGDGGWNCRLPEGATHASVHTTINVLEGLRLYALHRGALLPGRSAHAEEAQRRGREFLLAHRLFRSHRTGAVIKSALLQFSYPPRWHYDVLRALDHFQAAGAPRDERLAEAIELVRRKRRKDGRWLLENVHRGQTYFALERPGGPSRWNTLRARRVLAWWDGERG
jgi:hypothetical protein